MIGKFPSYMISVLMGLELHCVLFKVQFRLRNNCAHQVGRYLNIT